MSTVWKKIVDGITARCETVLITQGVSLYRSNKHIRPLTIRPEYTPSLSVWIERVDHTLISTRDNYEHEAEVHILYCVSAIDDSSVQIVDSEACDVTEALVSEIVTWATTVPGDYGTLQVEGTLEDTALGDIEGMVWRADIRIRVRYFQ